MSLFWTFLIVILAVAAVAARLLSVAARWGREMKELEAHGVATVGTVVRKLSYNSRGGRSRYLRYAYNDQFGRRHTRKTIVVGDAWEQHHEGGAIAVVYSQRTPKVSAAKFLLDTMSAAVREKEKRDAGPV